MKIKYRYFFTVCLLLSNIIVSKFTITGYRATLVGVLVFQLVCIINVLTAERFVLLFGQVYYE
jgi:hypothetical protein